MDIKILIVDDDAVFRELVCDIVKKQGFVPVQAKDGRQAIELFFNANDFDLIVLDVMMPGYDGWEVLKHIREYSDVPILMLTALGDEPHQVNGLQKGADDYITKPFSYEVFVARLNALLRKTVRDRLSTLIIGPLRIEQSSRNVFALEKESDLDRKEYDLLLYLIKNRNIAVTREQILAGVWGYDFDGDIRTIDTHIKTLRAKLGACAKSIITVRGIGYLFEAMP
jgi:two-component system, OmpR family, response regulator ResD